MKKLSIFITVLLLTLILVSCEKEIKPEIPGQIEDITYVVKFDTSGGTVINNQEVLENSKVLKPTNDPTKDGYDFINWYLDSNYNTLFDFNTLINSNITIYAKFEVKSLDLSLVDKEFVYNGSSHSLSISGSIPTGSTIEWDLNEYIIPGSYEINAIVKTPNNGDIKLKATLTIKKAIITGLTFTSKEFVYDGLAKSLVVTGNSLDSYDIDYSNNGKTEIGTYIVKAVINKEHYETLELEADLVITNKLITGLTFESKEVYYNGSAHSVFVEGNDLDLYTFTYTGNAKTEPGNYEVRVVIERDNYETLILETSLVIVPALIDISFKSTRYTYSGKNIEIILKGENLDDYNIEYEYYKANVLIDNIIELGDYKVIVTITRKNYQTLVLEETVKVLPSVKDRAKLILEKLINVPDAWSFLPESFKKENRVIANSNLDFTSNVLVSSIYKNGIGQQLAIVYETLLKLDSIMGTMNTINAASSAIMSAYQLFIDNNPDDFTVFENTEGMIQYKIVFNEDYYNMYLQIGSVKVDLEYDVINEVNTTRVEITNSNVVKYETTENSIKIAIQFLGTFTNQVEFIRDEDLVLGYVYDNTYIPVAKKELQTTSYLEIDSKYTKVSGTNGDFLLGSKGKLVEVYDNETGNLLGMEVQEELRFSGIGTTYDTLWYNIHDITGINSVKGIKKPLTSTDNNKYEVYVNNSVNIFEPKYNKVVLLNTSRQFDIEFKEMVYYTMDNEKLTKVKLDIPMLFVQRPNLNDYQSEIFKINKNNGITSNVTNIIKEQDDLAIADAYTRLLPIFDQIRELVSKKDIEDYLGKK